jgi:signal transduction histidine kinase
MVDVLRRRRVSILTACAVAARETPFRELASPDPAELLSAIVSRLDRDSSERSPEVENYAAARLDQGCELEDLVLECELLRRGVSAVWEREPEASPDIAARGVFESALHETLIAAASRCGRERRQRLEALDDLATLRESQRKLEQAVRLRDRLIATLAHDLKNPIGAIKVSTAVLLHWSPDLDPATRRRIETIGVAAKNAHRIMDAILNLAEVESGEVSLRLTSCDPVELVHEAIQVIEPLATEQGLSLTFERPAQPLRVECDHNRVSEVLGNLLGNAVKFTPRGGSITVRLESERDAVVCSVRDTGRGIPAEHQQTIFEWGCRVASATDPRGLGLGLAIAKGIVEAHGGRIWVESQGQGASTFRFTLPWAPKRFRS